MSMSALCTVMLRPAAWQSISIYSIITFVSTRDEADIRNFLSGINQIFLEFYAIGINHSKAKYSVLGLKMGYLDNFISDPSLSSKPKYIQYFQTLLKNVCKLSFHPSIASMRCRYLKYFPVDIQEMSYFGKSRNYAMTSLITIKKKK